MQVSGLTFLFALPQRFFSQRLCFLQSSKLLALRFFPPCPYLALSLLALERQQRGAVDPLRVCMPTQLMADSALSTLYVAFLYRLPPILH